MDYLELISVPAIAAVVYWVIDAIKYATKNNETFKRFIPLLSGGLGAVLGLIAYYAVPNIIAASNVVVAMLSGAASGLTATGYNQIVKQFCKFNCNKLDLPKENNQNIESKQPTDETTNEEKTTEDITDANADDKAENVAKI